MPKFSNVACKALALIGALASSAGVANAQFQLRTQSVASGLSLPLYVTSPNGDNNRLFVIEQRSGTTGRVRVINQPGGLSGLIYLSVTGISTGNEQGLLGLAFHPNFLQNGYFYVNYTRSAQAGISAGSTRIVRYQANAPFATSTSANAASATILLEIPQPETNHNGGWIGFGPDGYLYVGMGDGGCFNDQNNAACGSVFPHTAGGNAQDLTANLLGKMLRLDVDGLDNIPGNADDDGFPADPNKLYSIPPDNPHVANANDDEIYLHGVRNPWRSSFDRATGDLWIADVGQDVREEINYIPFATGGGRNLGWRCTEGTRNTGLSGCTFNDPAHTRPVLEYGHTVVVGPTNILGCSITGGYVYRGPSIPCLQGHYIFSDYCSGDIWTFKREANGTLSNLVDRSTELDPPGGQTVQNVTSFGEDNAGELYIVDQTGGEIFRIFAGPVGAPDCNNNNILDNCEIAAGLTPDVNGDGVPDVCQPTVCDSIDFNNDTSLFDPQDIDAFLSVYAEGPCVPVTATCNDIDFNNDTSLFDPCDIDSFLLQFAEGPCTPCGG